MNLQNQNTSASQLRIECVKIADLFGRYSYSLDFPSCEANAAALGIIYGENGTGKTTILEILFHLLSPARDKGHRTSLSKIPFRRFVVRFNNGMVISVARAGKEITGPYSMTILTAAGEEFSGMIQIREDKERSGDLFLTDMEEVLSFLANLDLSIYFLRDDRALQSDILGEDADEEIMEYVRYPSRRVVSRPRFLDRRDFALKQALNRSLTWLRRHAIQASSRGESGAQQIYASIVEKINRSGIPSIVDIDHEKHKLIDDINSLAYRSEAFSKLGFISRMDVERFIAGLRDASQDRFPFVSQVISSFIEGQIARLDALEDLNTLLQRFIDLVNGFLLHKHVEISATEGISIITDRGNELKPEHLSSGEKQLLLLLCHVLTSGDSASLFIIDEPEISLNVIWQRKLIDALMSITVGNKCQFLLATHSIELLTRHRNCVVQLISE